MDNMNLNKHISGQFNTELEAVRNNVLAMGGLVEQQLSDALVAIHDQDHDLARRIVETVPAPIGSKGTRVARSVDGDRVFLRTFTTTGRTAMETHSDGSWTRYNYDSQDRLASSHAPFTPLQKNSSSCSVSWI